MRVVLAHDSFTQVGGSERVFRAMQELFPGSTAFTLVVDSDVVAHVPGEPLTTSFLQRMYDLHPRFQHFLALAPVATWALSVPDADLLLTSSSAFARGIRKPPGAVHVTYCHTPTRFLWVDRDYVRAEVPPALRPLARVALRALAAWDKRAAAGVDHFIANSREVQGRIRRAYGRDSTILHPFVDVDYWRPTQPKGRAFLTGGRLQAYKRIDAVIDVFNELGWPLRVVGTGRQAARLQARARSNITFLGRVSDDVLRDEYSRARGFVYPQVEDFGMMPLEAAACGTATLAVAEGGSLETVKPGVTGELFESGVPGAMKAKLQVWEENRYAAGALREHAAAFSKEIFQRGMLQLLRGWVK